MEREADRAGLPSGVHDDAAHLTLAGKSQGVRDIAHQRATIMVFVRRHLLTGLSVGKIAALLPKAGLGQCPDELTLKRWLKRVEGVDPINFAPALAPDYCTTGRAPAECDPAAWEYFELNIAASGRNGTGANFREMWKQTREEAAKRGWSWPSYRTALRRWEKLDVARQRTLELGIEAAARSMTHYLPRSLEGMAAMEQAETDFREFKVLCIWEDGTGGCPWVGLVVDRASSKIVGRTVARSENEEAVVDLISDMAETHGIPDRMVQDNGSSFNGFRMMGGKIPLVRRKDKGPRNANWSVPGVYEFLGIEVINHGPRMAWAKLPESLNSVLRHLDNDPVLHRAQRTGPNDAPNPDPVPVPVALFRAALDHAIRAINADTDSRAKGLRKGESRNAAFQRLSAGRIANWPTPLQRRWMRLKWHTLTVTEAGQIRQDNRFWGDDTTSRAMLRYAGEKVVVGIDPADLTAAAMVYEWDAKTRKGKLLLEKLPAVVEALHDDQPSKHRAQAVKKQARDWAAAQAFPREVVDAHVAGLRVELMAAAGQPLPVPSAPAVTKFPGSGPFAPGPARHQPEDRDAVAEAKTAQYFALKAEGERSASGTTR
ncbi:MAG: hypothetical protein ACK4L4_05880 [Gemmobacter sp.]